uniref:N-acetylserotonin O-methyltransferase-like protein n=1 Tax=Callorhinchus milii TaxID=7868 RepID=V9KKS0_CALMI
MQEPEAHRIQTPATLQLTTMLNPVMSKLVGKRVVLASASPRRREILNNVGLRFEIVPSWFKETLDKSAFEMPYEYAKETAKEKALEVAKRMHLKHLKTPDIVIGADTVVSIDNDILEKPIDKKDAYRMLSRLSNKEHSVFTGVAIIQCCSGKENQLETKIIDFYEETKVKFADLSEELLWDYIHSGEPMDKAGGYGIQALGGMLVESVHGDFLNVVGFPLHHFCKKLAEIYNPPTCQGTKIHYVPTVQVSSGGPANHLGNGMAEEEFDSNQTVEFQASCPPGQTIQDNVSETGMDLHHNQAMASVSNESNVEFLHKVMGLIDGFKASQVLFTASKLKVFDMLSTSNGLEASDLAQKLEASVDGMERLLDACVSLGLLEKTSGTSQLYNNTTLAKMHLVTGGEYSLQGYISHSNNLIWPLFAHLDSAVKEGTNQYLRAFGIKSDELFQDSFYSSSKGTLNFMSAMHSISRLTGKDILKAFDLSPFKTACDLGGCTGALAYELVNIYQDVMVTVFDLPQVLEKVKSFQPQGQNLSRVSFKEGDFFKDDIPQVKLYILSRILQDWKEDKIDLLLSRLSQICKPGCGLLLAEMILYDRKTKSSRAVLQSLNMLVQTEGRERSGSEYRKLLQKHGFADVHIKPTGNLLDVILCIKQ